MHLKSNSPNALLPPAGFLIGNYAKVLGLGQNYLFTWLRDNGILIATGERRNVPKQNTYPWVFTLKETVIRYKQWKQDFFHDSYNGKVSSG
ncbi:putative host killing protein [Escherichia coli]|uniref:Putative host killing protein n=1 Tax=Escherichia coli TaxID=562 RepID=A0A377AXV9_ECOLX|nr:putative host killing protein [Escherichia coli]